ncbi:MAG TPA: flagellar basal body rod protein FlgC [Caproiciproducens sp.]|nr:flagellar basal body rod protein FlgC [Caproiciproducens sp.]
MAFLNSMDISGSGLTAERLRMDVISENIANATTTRTAKGGPYRRKMVVFEPVDQSQPTFRQLMENRMGSSDSSNSVKGGVQATKIVDDPSDFTPKYDPTNPDANAQGYVMMPNVDPITETLDMMETTRAYDANLTAFNAVKSMAEKALEMGR